MAVAEFASFEHVAGLASFIAEHRALGAALPDYIGGDLEEAREALEEHYLGCHASLADYMQEITEEEAAILETLRYYIDWQAMARDAEL